MTDNTNQQDVAGEPWDVTRHATAGARFVTCTQWRDGLPTEMLRSMAASVVADALVDAADEHGVIHNFVEKTFYCRHVARVLNRDLADTDVVEPLVYDRFSALALTDAVTTMLHRKLLAVRGTDNTVDYRLTLP
jgi:hypothetical protein